MRITVEEAASILDCIGCASDPVWHRGVETTIDDMAYTEFGSKSAAKIMIWWYGGHGRHIRRRRGSVRQMVIDRINN